VVTAGTAETEHETATWLVRIGRYVLDTSVGSGDGVGRQPALPRVPVNYRSIV